MKHIFTIFSLLVTVNLTAQNWSLVMPDDTLVYEKQDNNQFFTVWVDSTHVNGSDTTYFMNRISPGDSIGISPLEDLCDSTITWPTSFDLLNLYKPQFCGASILKSNNKWVVSFPQNEFIFYPKSSVGSSWVYDSLSLDSVVVASIDTAFLFGYQVTDSIKVLLVNGQEMIISKFHGVISWPDIIVNSDQYDLRGVQNLGLGDLIPMELDIFDFEVGDVFLRYYYWGDQDYHGDGREKRTILSKQIIGDTVIYSMKITGGYNLHGIVERKFWPNKYNFLSKYPNTIASSKMEFFTKSYWSIDDIPVETIQIIVIRDSKGVIVKLNYFPSTYLYNENQYCVDDTNKVAICFGRNLLYPVNVAYASGLGQTMEFEDGGFYRDEMNLIGYIKNGDTIGIVNSVPKVSEESIFKIFPNPTNDFITIETEKLNGISMLEMYDLQGRLIKTKTFERDLTLDVSQWSNGVYFAIIKNADGAVLHREKVVIQ